MNGAAECCIFQSTALFEFAMHYTKKTTINKQILCRFQKNVFQGSENWNSPSFFRCFAPCPAFLWAEKLSCSVVLPPKNAQTFIGRHFFFTPLISYCLKSLKVVWGKDTSRRSKEPGSDLPSCFSACAPFCKCGWRYHISRSGCGPDCLGVPTSAQWTYNWNFLSLHNLSILYFKALVCINYNYSVWFYIKIDLTWLNSGEPRKVNATL